jgi:hypothetical protein
LRATPAELLFRNNYPQRGDTLQHLPSFGRGISMAGCEKVGRPICVEAARRWLPASAALRDANSVSAIVLECSAILSATAAECFVIVIPIDAECSAMTSAIVCGYCAITSVTVLAMSCGCPALTGLGLLGFGFPEEIPYFDVKGLGQPAEGRRSGLPMP